MGLRFEDMMIFTVSFGSEALMDYLPSIVILVFFFLEIFFFRQGRLSIKVYLKIVWTWISLSISLRQL